MPENDVESKIMWASWTPKTRSIVGLLIADPGLGNKQIADHLGTTTQVIKNYLRQLYARSGIPNRTALVLWVADHPLLRQRLKEWRGIADTARA